MRGFLDGKEMTVQPECRRCFLRQTERALDMAGADPGVREQVAGDVLAVLGTADMGKSPAHATTLMHRRIRQRLGRDPFREVKARSTRAALELYPRLRETVRSSPDPLSTAARLAIAGNIMDFGLFSTVDVEGTIERALAAPLALDHGEMLRERLQAAGRVLYLLDNAGEAVLDGLLMEEVLSLGKPVAAAAKGAPVINDCTLEDARESGLPEQVAVMENGSDGVGTILQSTSEEFRRAFQEEGTLVISKGMANFETLLSERRKDVFFLFQSKCDVLSGVLEMPRGSMLLLCSEGPAPTGLVPGDQSLLPHHLRISKKGAMDPP
jgi:uncharacterized protein with ATP-grasp and redox domains